VTKFELLEKLNHDLASNIRNFQVAESLLSGDATEVATAADLLRASIEQLGGVHEFVLKEGSIKNLEKNQSMAAQK
jgi:hypothetical protein